MSGRPVVEILYELGGKFWHTNCLKGLHCGIMMPIVHERDRSLIRCLHCEQRAYYPVGAVGTVCAAEVTEGDPQP